MNVFEHPTSLAILLIGLFCLVMAGVILPSIRSAKLGCVVGAVGLLLVCIAFAVGVPLVATYEATGSPIPAEETTYDPNDPADEFICAMRRLVYPNGVVNNERARVCYR